MKRKKIYKSCVQNINIYDYLVQIYEAMNEVCYVTEFILKTAFLRPKFIAGEYEEHDLNMEKHGLLSLSSLSQTRNLGQITLILSFPHVYKVFFLFYEYLIKYQAEDRHLEMISSMFYITNICLFNFTTIYLPCLGRQMANINVC